MLPRLGALILEQPDRTLAELQRVLGTSASLATIWRAVAGLAFNVKKTVRASEQDRADVAAARTAWRQITSIDAARFVFLDESGVATDLLRRYARSRRGHRCTITRRTATGARAHSWRHSGSPA